jgi:predicted amidohydrolase
MVRLVVFSVALLAITLPLAGFEPSPAATAPRQAPAAPKTLRVAAVQMRSTRDLDANLKHARELLQQCARDGAQVAVFPECSVSGYFPDVIVALTPEQLAAAEKQVAQACAEFKIAAVIGMPWRENGQLFNSAIVIDAEGKVVERYHKIQLAEKWPAVGDHLSLFRLHGVPCSIIICHDERYPELVRLPVLAGARVVFYLSHESPLQAETKLAPYRAQVQARAAENTVFIVHANAPANADATGSHGQSRLVAPDGNIIKEAGMFAEEALLAELDLARATAANAQRSLSRGPLVKWYADGVKQVKIIAP